MELAMMLAKLMPMLIPLAQSLIDRGIKPEELDWDALYGKNLEDLRARIDAQMPEGRA